MTYTEAEIRDASALWASWFHNLDLDGVRTAPDHFLSDYPAVKWRRFAPRGARGPHRPDACSTSAATPASTRSR